MNESIPLELATRAVTLHEEGLLLFFPPNEDGKPNFDAAYSALNPKNPEDEALVIEPKAFDPFVDEDDIACDEDGEPIVWRFVRFYKAS
jgi:hypothetical protein